MNMLRATLNPLLAMLICFLIAPDIRAAERGAVVGSQSLGQYTPEALMTAVDEAIATGHASAKLNGAANAAPGVVTNLDEAEYSGWLDKVWEWIKRIFRAYWLYDIRFVVLNYPTVTAGGETINCSGLAIIPVTTNSSTRLPLLSFQHPTQVLRKNSPSICQLLDPQLSVPIAALIAASGYIVTLPDYPGMGVNSNVHPYCHHSLAYSCVDMVRATRNYLHTIGNHSWDGRLFLMGYSEGGYATLATAKELQLHHASEFTVSAVAPLDGPHSLSDTMKTVMLTAGTEYDSPYFLPYVVDGYDSVYAATISDLSWSNAIIPSTPSRPDFSVALRQVTESGTNSGSEIDALIRSVPGYAGPRSILTASFMAGLSNAASPIAVTLASNNSYAAWTPAMPIRLMHNREDDLVPFGNSTNAYRAFAAAASHTVALDAFCNLDYPLIYLLIQEMGSVHAATAPFAYLRGYQWLDSLAYTNRLSVPPPMDDADGDHIADLAVYWPAGGLWFVWQSALAAADTAQWGWPEAVPVMADYSGDGRQELAAFWPAAGYWFIRGSDQVSVRHEKWGWSAGDIPVPGDYDGDRRADLAVYTPASGLWHIRPSAADHTRIYQWGWPETIPVPGDYDGDGRQDPAVYWPKWGMWYILQSASGARRDAQWGWADALPVPADYDGDRQTDLAVYWPEAGRWHILRSSDGQTQTIQWGMPDTIPAPADYDGDGRADLAVYQAATGRWYILTGNFQTPAVYQWGWNETRPINRQAWINRQWFPTP